MGSLNSYAGPTCATHSLEGTSGETGAQHGKNPKKIKKNKKAEKRKVRASDALMGAARGCVKKRKKMCPAKGRGVACVSPVAHGSMMQALRARRRPSCELVVRVVVVHRQVVVERRPSIVQLVVHVRREMCPAKSRGALARTPTRPNCMARVSQKPRFERPRLT